MANFQKSTVASKRLGTNPPTHIPLKRAYQGLSNAHFGLRWNCLSFEKKWFSWAPRSFFCGFGEKLDLDKKCLEKCPTIFRGQKVPKIAILKFFLRKLHLRIIFPYQSSKSAFWSRRSFVLKFLVPPLKKYTMGGMSLKKLKKLKNCFQ